MLEDYIDMGKDLFCRKISLIHLDGYYYNKDLGYYFESDTLFRERIKKTIEEKERL